MDNWNDGVSDAEYCTRLFGDGFEFLKPYDYVSKSIHKIFYLFWTPLTQRLKVGKADDEKNLLLRLQERRRQCGETRILGFKYCVNPNKEEDWWKNELKGEWFDSNGNKVKPQIAREVFDFSFVDYPLRYIQELIKQRHIVCNENIEDLIKEYIEWDGNPENIPTLDFMI